MIDKKSFFLAVAVSWILTLVTVLLMVNFAPSLIQGITEQLPEKNSNQKISLETGNPAMRMLSDSYIFKVGVYLPEEIPTLFDCCIKVEYLTTNNTWKTTTKEIGIVNFQDMIEPQIYLDADFQSGNPYLTPDGYYHGDEEPNIHFEAYGFLRP